MNGKQETDFQSLFVASQLLTRSARRASEVLDSFSGWMLAGFGAAFALALANIQTLSRFVPVASLRRSALVFLVAVLIGVLQKGLASFVTSSAAAGLEGEALGQQLAASHVNVDFATVFREMERATLFPFRWAVRRAFRKTVNGDVAVAGRVCFKVAQIQGWFVAVESFLALVAAGMVVYALAV